MFHSVPESVSDSELLVRFLAGDEDARREFPNRMHQTLVLAVRRHRLSGNGTVDGRLRVTALDLAEDIAQEVWVALSRRSPGDYDPEQLSVISYLVGLIPNAVRSVLADFTPPGQRTRYYANEEKPKPPVSVYAVLGDDGLPLLDTVPDEVDEYAFVEDRLYVEDVLAIAACTAPSPVAGALSLIYTKHLNTGQAAEAVGLHPSTLRRQLDRWVQKQPVICIA